MAEIPTTSTTLLRNIAHDSQHARWSEFVTRYRPMMEAFLREYFPSVEADDVIQETLIAVCAALPSYRYAPEEKGHFHNYLTGILKNKALRQLSKDHRQAELAEMAGSRRRDGRGRAGRASLPDMVGGGANGIANTSTCVSPGTFTFADRSHTLRDSKSYTSAFTERFLVS